MIYLDWKYNRFSCSTEVLFQVLFMWTSTSTFELLVHKAPFGLGMMTKRNLLEKPLEAKAYLCP